MKLKMKTVFRIVDFLMFVLYGATVFIAGLTTYLRINEYTNNSIIVNVITLLVGGLAAWLLFPKSLIFPSKMSPEDLAKFRRL